MTILTRDELLEQIDIFDYLIENAIENELWLAAELETTMQKELWQRL